MKYLLSLLALGMLTTGLGPAVRGQEPELVSEIVAQVNNDIITRADYINALHDFKEELKQQMPGKSDAEVNAEYEKLKSTVLDILIENMLLEQKAKELNIDVEADVNQQMLQMAKENGLKTIIELEAKMKEQGLDPEVARAQLRRQIQQQYVIQKEVLSPLMQQVTDKDRHEFYEKYPQYFTIPGEVMLSEIFLPFEGHSAQEVEQRSKRLVTELRAGSSFVDAVKNNSAPSHASRAQDGKMGSFKVEDLNQNVAAAISALKPGEVTDPIRLQDGYQIVRVDDRKAATTRKFEDPEIQNQIGRAVTMSRAEARRKQYLQSLRTDAYIDVKKGYSTSEGKTAKAEGKTGEKE